MTVNADIIIAARTWIGTPYHHGASLRGAGCDCLGLIRGVYVDMIGEMPCSLPPYRPDWAEATRADLMARGFRQYLVEKSVSEAVPGDVLLYCLNPTGLARHAAILSGPDHMIHAWERSPVCEVAIDRFWRGRLTNVFSYPGTN